ncbi:heme-dependent oxidative N-demethylase family protein [Pseudoprimorskyibacter insulae]|uniref:DUF3445 domain-containing protein n=1 Tax=Pseudoprimorskyibacter insulae TaxID=1695997 RepID=A0A2R8AXX8_9RHOB|nr:DUF3445 domain-containing protein [Pseudoprimorskyibacter insulae]SPF80860.1 hypothetical protein PRI8871_02673 [Pseudoprimorskyibacter insulae]
MILQTNIPYDPLTRHRLPGIRPLGNLPWLIADEAHAGQMALRDSLLTETPDLVKAQQPGAEDAAAELLQHVLTHLPKGYRVADERCQRPDGAWIDLTNTSPLETAGRLVQEDLCLLRPTSDGEYNLVAAILCFPASWTLAEKIGRPMTAIHAPVDEYDPTMARRVGRLFDCLRDDAPLWRYNAMWYSDPSLFQPRLEAAPRRPAVEGTKYMRSERQVLKRLPKSGAVVFSIHSYVLRPGWSVTPLR